MFRNIEHRLAQIACLRRTVQALRVAAALEERGRFLVDCALDRPLGTYTSRRTREKLHFRPRLDLQVARELISKDNYVLPARAISALRNRSPTQILDVGANIGLFTLYCLRTFEISRVLAVEPDPSNIPILRANLDSNDVSKRVELREAAVSNASGSAQFAMGCQHTSHLLSGEEEKRGRNIVDVALLDFFEISESADLVKMDIEGGEWPILRDPRLQNLNARVIALEYHQRNSGTDSPVDAARELLERAGYHISVEAYSRVELGFLWAFRE